MEDAVRTLLQAKGYNPDQFRQETIALMKEYGLEKHIHPDFLKKDSLTIGALSMEIMSVKLEVLSILQALEFAGYSENAREKALQKLSARISELSRESPSQNLFLKLGLYTYTLKAIRRGEFGELVDFLKRTLNQKTWE